MLHARRAYISMALRRRCPKGLDEENSQVLEDRVSGGHAELRVGGLPGAFVNRKTLCRAAFFSTNRPRPPVQTRRDATATRMALTDLFEAFDRRRGRCVLFATARRFVRAMLRLSWAPALCVAALQFWSLALARKAPNMIWIMADDLGWGEA